MLTTGLVVCNDEKEVVEFLQKLKEEFQITIGALDCFPGMQIKQLEDGSIFVAQHTYLLKVLEKFRMAESNAVATPCEKRDGLSEEDHEVGEETPYRQAVGSLMYLMTATRPDIAYAVSIVSENLEKPKESDWLAVKRIFKYLKGTSGYGLLRKPDISRGGLREKIGPGDFFKTAHI